MTSLEKINYLIAEMETTGEFSNCTYISKNDCNMIKKELEDYQFLKKLHNQMKEEMERECNAQRKLAHENLERESKDSYWYCMGRASCYRDLLDYYDEEWVKENVK